MDLEAEHGTDYIISISEGCGNVLEAASEHGILLGVCPIFVCVNVLLVEQSKTEDDELEDVHKRNSCIFIGLEVQKREG